MIELEKSRDHYVDFYDCTPPLLSHSRALLAPVRPVCHQARPLPSGQDPTIPRSFWAGAYYQQQRKKGCSHLLALRELAFKWIPPNVLICIPFICLVSTSYSFC